MEEEARHYEQSIAIAAAGSKEGHQSIKKIINSLKKEIKNLSK